MRDDVVAVGPLDQVVALVRGCHQVGGAGECRDGPLGERDGMVVAKNRCPVSERHCQGLITRPQETILVLISDLLEGAGAARCGPRSRLGRP